MVLNRSCKAFKLAAAFFIASGLLLNAESARAQTTTFAQYQEFSSDPDKFSYDDATQLLTLTAPIRVRFTYGVANGYGDADEIINATLQSFTASIGSDTNSARTIFNGAATNVSFLITADAPSSTGFTRLLQLNAGSTGVLSLDGGSGSIAGSTQGGDIVGFSSDFLDFTNTTDRNYSFSFSAVNPAVGSSPTYDTNPNVLRDFTADSTATFASNPPPVAVTPAIPEPGSIALLVFAAAPVVGGVVRARRKAR